MLSAIRDIGETSRGKPKKTKPRENIKVISILLDVDKKLYQGIEIEDFESTKEDIYLFNEGSSKGNAPYPFCPIRNPEKKPTPGRKPTHERTLDKISVWLKNCLNNKNTKLKPEDSLMLRGSVELLQRNKNSIKEDLTRIINEFPRKYSKFLTVKINSCFLGEYQLFKECLNSIETQKRKKSYDVSTCSICGDSNKEVSGKTDVFKFYTIDKPGFISGGFKEITAWKNFPVCKECYVALKDGRKYIENNLSFNFYGYKYLLIPKLLLSEKDSLAFLLDKLSQTKKEISLKERILRRLTDDEEEILDFLSEQKDQLTINFLFLQKIQSAERIVLAIEDIFPSRIRRIFQAKEFTDELFQNNPDKGFTFAHIRTFFSKSDEYKKKADLDKYFLSLVCSIFNGNEVNFSFLVKFIMPVIRRELTKEDSFILFRIKSAMMVVSFLEKLEIIKFREVSAMTDGILDTIFKRFGNSFASPPKRGIFLIGVLTQLLLNKQSSVRNTKQPPFMKKLKGLRMEEKDIKGLLPQLINKLEEYESFDYGKQKVAAEASKYLLESGEDWKMSIDEINYYFACGMSLAGEVANLIYKEMKED